MALAAPASEHPTWDLDGLHVEVIALHRFRQSSDPIEAPVPTAGMSRTRSSNLSKPALLPKDAATTSRGRLKRPFAMLCVPASSEFRADIKVAFLQPIARD
jgi:hypothetical protein